MFINREDGTCCECDGQLEVVDASDVSMTVSCLECQASYDVETDAFGDGCVVYYIPFMTERMLSQDSGGD